MRRPSQETAFNNNQKDSHKNLFTKFKQIHS